MSRQNIIQFSNEPGLKKLKVVTRGMKVTTLTYNRVVIKGAYELIGELMLMLVNLIL